MFYIMSPRSSARPRRPQAGSIAQAAIRGALLLAVCAAAHLSLPARVQADDARWSSDFAVPGVDGTVYDLVAWNGGLVVAGDFDYAGGHPAANVALFDGTGFQSLGDGFDQIVRSVAVVDGTLFAAGEFTASGVTPLPNVARWDGTAWVAVGSAPPDYAGGLSLEVDGSSLLLLGEFVEIDSPPVIANGLARWNGSAWTDVEGFAPWSGGWMASAVRVGSRLYVGGLNLHYLEGSTWTYGFGVFGSVSSLAEYGGELYACGEFETVDGIEDPVGGIARFDGGTWHTLADVAPDGIFGRLAVNDGRLLALGSFASVPGPRIAWWDGANWAPGPYLIFGNLWASAEFGGDLVLGGVIDGYFGIQGPLFVHENAEGLVAFDGTALHAVGPGAGVGGNTSINGLEPYAGKLIATGDFDRIGNLGGVGAVAAWDGSAWSPLGAGLSEPFGNPHAKEMTTWGTKLVVTGYFTGAEALESANIIAWNGTSWEGLDGGFSGQSAKVASLGGTLYASTSLGNLGTAYGSGGTLGHVARWTGSAWETVGTRSGGGSTSDHDLVEWNGTLVYGASFTAMNGVPASNIARWDGTAWSALGDGFNGFVTSLGVHDGDLYASGLFTASGATALPGRMARWTGSAWEPVGSGLDAVALDMVSEGGILYVSGGFTQAGGAPAPGIAAWDGANWSPLGSGIGQGSGGNGAGAHRLAVYDGGLYAGGYFNRAGDKDADRIARWDLGSTASLDPTFATSGLRLSAPVPNPSTGRATLTFSLAVPARTEAAVFDVRGRRVRSLTTGTVPAGEGTVVWDGRDDAGAPVRAGVYWVRLTSGEAAIAQRVVRVQ